MRTAVILLLLGTGCAGPQIVGRAVNEAGRPLPGVRIATVPETRDALAGLDGAFVIDEQRIGLRTNKLPLGDYDITGAKMGCVQAMPTQVRVSKDHSPKAVIVMDCRPERERANAAPAVPEPAPERGRAPYRRTLTPGEVFTGL